MLICDDNLKIENMIFHDICYKNECLSPAIIFSNIEKNGLGTLVVTQCVDVCHLLFFKRHSVQVEMMNISMLSRTLVLRGPPGLDTAFLWCV